MPDISSASFSETDASNNAPAPDGAPEGMAPSGVNDTIRAVMGALKRFYDHINATVTSGGTANAQTLTYPVAPAAYATGDTYAFIAGATNTGAATLDVNGLGATAIQVGASALAGGEIVSGQPALAVYDGTQFQLLGRALAPTRTVLTSGSAATYTTPAAALWIDVELVGGGGGGGGSASSGGDGGGTGGSTTFGTLTATGGTGGGHNSGNPGGGGSASGGDININGNNGVVVPALTTSGGGGGGGGPWGGAGSGAAPNNNGANAGANSGAGGGGAGANGGSGPGGGGAAGGYVRKIFAPPGATYTYTVGAAGAAGSPGNGVSGGSGGAGIIIVTEYYGP